MENLIKKAKAKFDWHLDYLQLGSQFFKASDIKDFPVMKTRENRKDWQNFFLQKADLLGKKILK